MNCGKSTKNTRQRSKKQKAMSNADIIERLSKIEALTRLAAKNVFNVEELALYLNRSPKTIYNIVDQIPHHKDPNGRYTFRRNEIEDWQCSVDCATISIR